MQPKLYLFSIFVSQEKKGLYAPAFKDDVPSVARLFIVVMMAVSF
jgi:hypothetical protein